VIGDYHQRPSLEYDAAPPIANVTVVDGAAAERDECTH